MSAHSGEERLGPYRLRERLGEGGMGVVYLGSDPSDRLVAIKVLREGAPAEMTARRRLAREVDTMRRVHSPYVAEVIDADVEGSPPYIVTRYVAGQTLEDVVAAGGPITGQALASLARGLAGALLAIHSAGVVHRDLKPGNVMLVDGEPVVIDFGIAQSPDSTRLTMTGMFMGTPGYLAPEVIEGQPSGPAADVHSWAATMAYAATGRPPFGTGQFEAIFYRIVQGQPELATMPAPLLPIVLAGLARDPGNRPSAADLAALTESLDPAALMPGPASAASNGSHQAVLSLSSEVTRTAAAAPAVSAAAAAAPAAWPGTRPMAVQPKDDFADLLPPVQPWPAGAVPLSPMPAGAGPWPPLAHSRAAGAQLEQRRTVSSRPAAAGAGYAGRSGGRQRAPANCGRGRSARAARAAACHRRHHPLAGPPPGTPGPPAERRGVGDDLLPVGCLPLGAHLRAARPGGGALRRGGSGRGGARGRPASASQSQRIRGRRFRRQLLHRARLAALPSAAQQVLRARHPIRSGSRTGLDRRSRAGDRCHRGRSNAGVQASGQPFTSGISSRRRQSATPDFISCMGTWLMSAGGSFAGSGSSRLPAAVRLPVRWAGQLAI